MVYLILRELLKTRFPLEVCWEEKYPNTKQNADLLLKHGENKVYVEFKIWDYDKVIKIKSKNKPFEDDIKKLESLPEPSRGFVFLIWFDSNTEKGKRL